jgi:hypothetical protein
MVINSIGCFTNFKELQQKGDNMRRQCNNCIWYRSFPQECRFKMGEWVKKNPFTKPCGNYRPDRNMVMEEKKVK